jgi:hypothetical protein
VTIAPGELVAAALPVPLKRVSPSRFIGLQRCRLREVWTASRTPSLLPASARARLGTVVHRLLERVGKDAVPTEHVTSALWNEELQKVESEMKASWLDRSLVPLSLTVANAEVHKLRALDRARKMAAELPLKREGSAGSKGLGFEVWLQSPDGSVGGFIDCALRDEGLVIRDYKSGAIYEKDDGSEPKIRDEYVIQIQMYAALYNDTFGVWPERLEIVPIRGDEARVPVDKLRCGQLVDDARLLLSEVNAAVAALHHTGALGPSSLANPSIETCTPCGFRPQCSAYLAANPDLAERWPLDIVGTTTKIQSLGNGSVMLALTDGRGIIHSVRGLAPGQRHPALNAIEPGSHIGVFNLQRKYPAKDLTESPYTTVYRLPAFP